MDLGRIRIYPIKSLDGVEVREAVITEGGTLEHDREYAIFDVDGKVVNGKRTARIHQLRSEFDAGVKEVCLWEGDGGVPEQFALDAPGRLNAWLSAFFGLEVEVRRDARVGFPDDTGASGPTLVSEASLGAVQEWFPELDVEGVRRRFRANLEITGGEAFCEDALYGEAGAYREFSIGEVRLLGSNPCQRCAVPTREPGSGEVLAGFQKRFMELRRKHLPPWANAERFNHYYRFAVNTLVAEGEGGKVMRVGDAVSFPG